MNYAPEKLNTILGMLNQIREIVEDRPLDFWTRANVDYTKELQAPQELEAIINKVFINPPFEIGDLSTSQRKSFNKKRKMALEILERVKLLSLDWPKPSREETKQNYISKFKNITNE